MVSMADTTRELAANRTRQGAPRQDIHSVGTHVLVDMYGVRAELLADERLLSDLLLSSLEQSGFNVIKLVSHKFPGHQAGVTAIALLSESHATFHTYPEYGLLAMDIFSCGSANPGSALNAIVAALAPTRVEKSETMRGTQV